MTGSSATWSKETDEKINYTKLCRLLVDGGTQAVRSLFDGKHPPSSLKATLNANQATLQRLKKPRGKVLNNEQWDKLYPPSGSNPTSEDFDITLLFVLLRNICGLTPPATGWNVLPPVTDNSLEANLARIKYYRNNTIAHKPNTAINDVDFEQHWQDISSALLSLRLSQVNIDHLKSAPLGEKNYNQLLDDWCMSDEDIKTQLDYIKSKTAAIKSDTAAIKSDTADIKSDTAKIESETADIKSETADIKSDTAEIKSDTAAIKSDTAAIKSDTALIPGIQEDISQLKNIYSSTHLKDSRIDQLANSDFSSLIESLCKSFHPNTRQWVLDEVKSHICGDKSEPCKMLITAGPGMGKSTIAAKVCQGYKDLGCLAACHFFQFSNSTRNDPRLMLQSIARQMCDTVPGYREALERKLETDLGKEISEMNCEELFTMLLEEPLPQKLKTNEQAFVVILDAIDECCSKLKHELQDILKNKLSLLPSWLRFVITTRPPPSFNALTAKRKISIDPKGPENQRDIEIFFKGKVKDIEDQSRDVGQLVELSGGLFLVAFFLIDEVQRRKISSSELKDIFPHGLSSVYEKYLERLKTVLLPYIIEEEGFFKMLEAVVASKDPIPKEMLYSILGLKNASEIPRAQKKSRTDALSQLHSLFPVENDHVHVFHKSVFDFLILEEKEDDFNIPAKKMRQNGIGKVPHKAKSLQTTSKGPCSSGHVATQNEIKDRKRTLDTVCMEELTKNHDFHVRVNDGNKVLVSHCYGVLNDILNGKKDMNEPLELTDSEEFALQFAWSSKVTLLAKDHQKLRNYLTFVAYIFSSSFTNDIVYPDKLGGIIREVKLIKRHHSKESCPFRTNPKFGFCIELVLSAAYDKEVSETEISPNPLTLLKEHNLSYFLRDRIAVDSGENQRVLQAVACENGFVLLRRYKNNTEMHKYQLDGTCLAKKSFQGDRRIFMSPNGHFIVVIREMEKGEIEVIDAATLDVVSSFQSPNVIRSHHVYGNEPWYIVLRCYNNKIYVMEGETGQMVFAPVEVGQYLDVIAVSASGHVLLSTVWESTRSKDAKALFTDEDGKFLEIMNWPQMRDYLSKESSGTFPSNNWVRVCAYTIYRKLFLFHLEKSEERMPIYPHKTNLCACSSHPPNPLNDRRPFYDDGRPFSDDGRAFSEDGKLLAFIYNGSLFIIRTSSNLLYKQVYLGPGFKGSSELVFFSDPYVIINNLGKVMFINIETNEIEHRFLTENYEKFLVVPRKQGEPFTLIKSAESFLATSTRDLVLPGLYFPALTKYEFHNLKL